MNISYSYHNKGCGFCSQWYVEHPSWGVWIWVGANKSPEYSLADISYGYQIGLFIKTGLVIWTYTHIHTCIHHTYTNTNNLSLTHAINCYSEKWSPKTNWIYILNKMRNWNLTNLFYSSYSIGIEILYLRFFKNGIWRQIPLRFRRNLIDVAQNKRFHRNVAWSLYISLRIQSKSNIYHTYDHLWKEKSDLSAIQIRMTSCKLCLFWRKGKRWNRSRSDKYF